MNNRLLSPLVLLGIAFLLPMAFGVNHGSAAEVLIVGNKNVPADSLTQAMVQDIFLGKKTTWDDNTRIVFVVQKKSEAHDLFLKNYVKKSAAQFSNYWKKIVFAGKGSMPKSFASEEELLQFVAETGGAVGYVLSGGSLDNVKTINVQ